MATELLPIASTAANSAEFTVQAGTPVAIALKGGVGGAQVFVELKDDASAWAVIGELRTDIGPSGGAAVISIAGVYRVSRKVGAACGVFRA